MGTPDWALLSLNSSLSFMVVFPLFHLFCLFCPCLPIFLLFLWTIREERRWSGTLGANIFFVFFPLDKKRTKQHLGDLFVLRYSTALPISLKSILVFGDHWGLRGRSLRTKRDIAIAKFIREIFVWWNHLPGKIVLTKQKNWHNRPKSW